MRFFANQGESCLGKLEQPSRYKSFSKPGPLPVWYMLKNFNKPNVIHVYMLNNFNKPIVIHVYMLNNFNKPIVIHVYMLNNFNKPNVIHAIDELAAVI